MSAESSTKSSDRVIFKVGSRKSKLALIQTRSVIEALRQNFPDKQFEIVEMSTTGDKILDKPLPKIGEKSLFTKELEAALEEGAVDFVVHSLKDLPTTLPEGMAIGAVCKREDPRDAVMFHPEIKSKTLAELPKGSIIGTSSLRRMAQLRQRYPHLEVHSIRGNLNTRLAKLEASLLNEEGLVDSPHGYSALLLAAAGMERMDWKDKIGQVLEPAEQLYAVGQGALAVECRENDVGTLELLAPLYHKESAYRVIAERSLLRSLEGGCSAPVAVQSYIREQTLHLQAGVWSLDGKQSIIRESSVSLQLPNEPPAKKMRGEQLYAGIAASQCQRQLLAAAEKLGMDVAKQLEDAGSKPIMDAARAENEQSEQAKVEMRKMLENMPGGHLCLAARQAAGENI